MVIQLYPTTPPPNAKGKAHKHDPNVKLRGEGTLVYKYNTNHKSRIKTVHTTTLTPALTSKLLAQGIEVKVVNNGHLLYTLRTGEMGEWNSGYLVK